MIRHHFRRGLEIKWRERRFVVERRDGSNNIQIRDISTNDYLSFPEDELVEAIFNGELKVDSAPPPASSGSLLKLPDDLSLVPEHRRDIAKLRFKYVQRCIQAKVNSATKSLIEPIIIEVAKETKDLNPPSWSSVYRWMKAYLDAECDIRALLPKHRKGNTARKFGTGKRKPITERERELASETAKLVEDVINEHYLTNQRLSVEAVYDLISARIFEINRFRDRENRLPQPAKSSIYNIVSNIDEYEKDLARLGKRIAEQKHLQRGLGPRPSRPLERVEIDHTKIDLFIFDDVFRLPLGRPWLTTIIDKYSSMILGRYVSFEGPGSNSVFQCLLHAIRPKTYLQQDYPNIQNPWECYGLPESIACDNGLEFLSGHFADAMLQLGIHIEYSPVRQPWYKSLIERYFGILNKKLLHRLPGTTFSSILEKADYDPLKNAVISMRAFLEILDTWIVDIYSQEIHRGYEQTGPQKIPALSWREGIKRFPPALPQSDLNLDILLKKIAYRTVDASGIEIFNLIYNTPELALIRRELKKGEKIAVKYDTSDISLIYAADLKREIYIPVPALAQNYTKGLSLYQHDIIKKYTQEHLKNQINPEALVTAKMRVQQIVEQEIMNTKKVKSRVSAARFLKVDSNRKRDNQNVIRDQYSLIGKPVPMLPPANFQETGLNAEIEEPNVIAPSLESSAGKTHKKKPKSKSTDKDTGKNTIENFESNSNAAATQKEIDMSGWSVSFDLPSKK